MQRSRTERILTPQAKTAFIAGLTGANKDKLFNAVLQAVLMPDSYEFPPQVKEILGSLPREYIRLQHIENVGPPLKVGLENLVSTVVMPIINNLIKLSINPDEWQSELLCFLSAELKIEIKSEPVVQATIKDGKVYWRIMQDEKVVYDRPHNINSGVTFTDENSWCSDWETFRLFKDSGKRNSPVCITKERLSNALLSHNLLASAKLKKNITASNECAAKAWDELKAKGILTHKDKLSPAWRAMSRHALKLDAIEKLQCSNTYKENLYRALGETLMQLANNQEFAEQINGIDNARKFRAERTHQNWSAKANISHHEPHEDAHRSKLWDIATYHELVKHRNSDKEEKLYGEILNYDHIPSATLVNHLAGENPGYKVKKFTYAIAIPESLHRHGATYMVPLAKQLEYKGNPFFRDVSTHLQNIEKSPAIYNLNGENDYLKAIGAFRTLYHTEIKPVAKIPGTNCSIGKQAATLFSKPADKQALDNLFISKMQAAMKKR